MSLQRMTLKQDAGGESRRGRDALISRQGQRLHLLFTFSSFSSTVLRFFSICSSYSSYICQSFASAVSYFLFTFPSNLPFILLSSSLSFPSVYHFTCHFIFFFLPPSSIFTLNLNFIMIKFHLRIIPSPLVPPPALPPYYQSPSFFSYERIIDFISLTVALIHREAFMRKNMHLFI